LVGIRRRPIRKEKEEKERRWREEGKEMIASNTFKLKSNLKSNP